MNIMIDLETLDTKPSSVILSVGLVAFDDEKIYDTLYVVPPAQPQLDLGRTVSFSTIAWWMQQSTEAKSVFKEQEKNQSSLKYATYLSEIANFIQSYPKAKLYSYGSDFDLVILSHAFNHANMKVPWFFTNNRCFRTWCDDRNVPYKSSKSPDVTHNALQDAIDQANHMISVKKNVTIAQNNVKINNP